MLASAAIYSAPVHAQASYTVNLPAQSLGTSLRALGSAMGVSIAFDPKTVRNRPAPALRGAFTAREGLDKLLRGSGLAARPTANGSYLILAEPEERPRVHAIAQRTMPVPVAAAAAAAPAQAAAPVEARAAVSDAPVIEDIVVTAQKREENLQDTPISIAVMTSDSLEQRGIKGVTDLMGGAVPSLRMMPISGRASAFAIGIRGMGSLDAGSISRDASVGLYVDGVYLGRAQGLGSELFEVERIEVARGPQGTLFGRNAVGGAVSITSKKPTGEWGGTLDAGVRNFDGHNLGAHVNLPEFANIKVKLEGVWSERGGWIDNTLAGAWDWYAYDRYGARATALWEPTSDISVQYSFDKSRDKSTAGYSHLTSAAPGALAPFITLDEGRQRVGRMGVPLDPSVGKTEGHSLHVTWDINNALTLRSISAYRELSQSQFDNDTGFTLAYRPGGMTARYSIANVNQDQFSQEIQLLGTHEHLTYVLGGFYFEEDANDLAHVLYSARYNATGTGIELLDPMTGGAFPDRASVNHVKSTAVFGQATWTPAILDERLHLTGGLRWTHDRKEGSMVKVAGQPSSLGYQFESKRLDPAATIAFDWTPDVNTYLRWGTAYRSGGANSRSPTYRSFGEEEVESWELGLKSELFDRRARFNLAAYHARLRDMQILFNNPAAGSVTETINTNQPATIKGVEADLTVVPARGVTLTGSYAYTDWKVPPQLNPFTGNVDRVVLIIAPTHAASLSADYRLEPWSFGALSFHVDANYSSGFYAHPTDDTKTSPYWLLNGRVTLGDLDLGGADASVSLWAKNLTNTAYEVFDIGITGRGTINGAMRYYNEPRTYGVDLKVKF
ncbi:TonB-dependent receptor domain-containing protein [Sphingomonas sp. C3-2]|uniref:TonB-dependent receptor domain-containing protein n=1 Tax=Sphingomonas sp. C3-2 TaxID=3062169 RepID=UPI00294AED24|nr:TonB-dependent receptor [Sphingomonas sp. C3-2]WOK36007.1 TonB-dependent receptor plug domain-containing protein [Sphingomonas sp. C3-2]